MLNKRIMVTKELTGAWEIWEYLVPENFDPSLLDSGEYDGWLSESGFDWETVTEIEDEDGNFYDL